MTHFLVHVKGACGGFIVENENVKIPSSESCCRDYPWHRLSWYGRNTWLSSMMGVGPSGVNVLMSSLQSVSGAQQSRSERRAEAAESSGGLEGSSLHWRNAAVRSVQGDLDLQENSWTPSKTNLLIIVTQVLSCSSAGVQLPAHGPHPFRSQSQDLVNDGKRLDS